MGNGLKVIEDFAPEKFKGILASKGFTPCSFADAYAFSRPSVYAWMKGTTKPSTRMFEKMVKTLSVEDTALRDIPMEKPIEVKPEPVPVIQKPVEMVRQQPIIKPGDIYEVTFNTNQNSRQFVILRNDPDTGTFVCLSMMSTRMFESQIGVQSERIMWVSPTRITSVSTKGNKLRFITSIPPKEFDGIRMAVVKELGLETLTKWIVQHVEMPVTDKKTADLEQEVIDAKTALIAAEAERDTYKQLYSEMLKLFSQNQ